MVVLVRLPRCRPWEEDLYDLLKKCSQGKPGRKWGQQQCPPGHDPAESSFSLLPERKLEYKIHDRIACSQMSLVKCQPRRHNSHVLSALYLLGKLGSRSQRVRRKAMNTVFGKHRKPRWYTKTAKWYPRGLSRVPPISSTLHMTSELWRDRYRRKGEVDHSFFLKHLRQCLPRVF